MRIIKKLRAQQLIEFLLVVPFMMIILGVVTEYAYALNVNLSLYNGMRTVTSTIYSEIKPGMTSTDIHDFVQERLENYLVANNIPLSAANNLTVNIVTNADFAAFVVSYNYLSAFTLPNVYFHVLPAKLNFTAVSVVPAAFLKPNNYPPDISSTVLDGIWGSHAYNDAGGLTALDAFLPTENGIMNEPLAPMSADTQNLAFVVPINGLETISPFDKATPYYVVNWDGTLKSQFVANFQNNSLYDCSGVNAFGLYYHCLPVAGSATGLVSGRWNVIAIDLSDFSTPYPYNVVIFLNQWLQKDGNTYLGNVSDADDGALRQFLGLNNMSQGASAPLNGNYDGLLVSTYNPTASFGNKYIMQSQGSYIFVHGNDTFAHMPFGGNGWVNFD